MPHEPVGIDPVYIGALAGVATSILWVLTSLFFTAAGRRISVTAVNTLRIVVAIVLLACTQAFLSGSIVPEIAQARQILYLALSGLIGLSLCDQALFTAFVDIGPRRALLFMTSSPIFAVLFGAVFLHESVLPVAFLGIAVTITGILMVVLERPEQETPGPPIRAPHFRRGVVLAFLAAVSQAAGSMFSKLGMGIGWLPEADQLPTISATLVRMVFGLFGMAPIVLVYVVLLRRRAGQERIAHRWKSGVALTAAGAVVGPFLGVWMSLVAFKNSPIGVAQTLASLSPVFILPFSHFLLKDRVTRRAIMGAFVAMAGAAVLALAPAIHRAIG
ncbi:MAG: DMT family transporter [Phycisphaerales bacterium]